MAKEKGITVILRDPVYNNVPVYPKTLISNLLDENGEEGSSAFPSTEELGYLQGAESNIQEQLDGKQPNVTGAATSVVSDNLLPNLVLISDASGKITVHTSISNTELGYLDGVTSNIQTQLNGKQGTIGGAASTITSSNLTASRALVSDTNGKVAVSAVTSTELGYLDGVTSAIQTQLGGKQATITGAATTIASSNLTANRGLVSDANGKVAVSAATLTELSYLSGVTSNIQVQLNGKQATHSHPYLPTAGGTVTGVTTFSNTTASTSTTTGAVKISGGLGVAGNVYSSKVVGAVWNDYAEYRTCKDENVTIGDVVVECGNDEVELCKKRLSKAAMISSDTAGMLIGKEENGIPIAVAGRVLAYPDKPRKHFKIGDTVCSGKNGYVSKMRWYEKILFPDRILGIVSGIPDYEVWGTGNVQVNGRIWITI